MPRAPLAGAEVLPVLSQSRRLPVVVPPKVEGWACRCASGTLIPPSWRLSSSPLRVSVNVVAREWSAPAAVLTVSVVLWSWSTVTSSAWVERRGLYRDTAIDGACSGAPSKGRVPGMVRVRSATNRGRSRLTRPAWINWPSRTACPSTDTEVICACQPCPPGGATWFSADSRCAQPSKKNAGVGPTGWNICASAR
ncbi:hypothetical protein N7U49_35670 [Streptomyces sp. AD2-2]|nr:hypothetical protein N7U49_35670 [Streptomyces sp. AD2-2]